ncbi:vitelline membrane outer layer protein 1 homolog [Bufo gargarizans]|uniref:vitelline membrane outer layer protein 1 homolog n=1 Tax=Bufo gargarizans TaxID=30331 RepID=UPI001CF4020B|nr:vitelline membrane outer layer protein 1 homolog [Bufo gargarizans]
MWSSVAVLLLIQAALSYGEWISVANGGRWGNWGDVQRCPPDSRAVGFNLKVEESQRKGDDTALNGIGLFCAYPNGSPAGMITSSVSQWGRWGNGLWCQKHLAAFRLQVEPSQSKGDDTAANNMEMLCSDPKHLIGIGGHWGTYGSWSPSCYTGICAIKTKVEAPQGRGDDTALNDVQFECC